MHHWWTLLPRPCPLKARRVLRCTMPSARAHASCKADVGSYPLLRSESIDSTTRLPFPRQTSTQRVQLKCREVPVEPHSVRLAPSHQQRPIGQHRLRVEGRHAIMLDIPVATSREHTRVQMSIPHAATPKSPTLFRVEVTLLQHKRDD